MVRFDILALVTTILSEIDKKFKVEVHLRIINNSWWDSYINIQYNVSFQYYLFDQIG